MDRDFFFNSHFNIKDIKDILKKLPSDKKITREAIEIAFSYDRENKKEVTDAMLTIFDNLDGKLGNKDGEIDYKELSLFLKDIEVAAGEDMTLSKQEAADFSKTFLGQSESSNIKPNDVFNFLRVLQVNMENPVITDDSLTIDEIVVTPNGNYSQDNTYQKGQVVSISPNEFGTAKDWVDLAKNLYRAEGYSENDYTSVEWNRRASELRKLNDGKALKELSRVKVKLSNNAILNNEEKLQASYEEYIDNMALPIAEKISSILKNNSGADSTDKISELLDNNTINSENIVPLFNMYMSDKKILNGDTTLIDGIMSESAFLASTRTEVRKKQKVLMERIIDLLDKAAQEAGVEDDIRNGFTSNLKSQLSNIFVWSDLVTLTAEWNDKTKSNFEGTIKEFVSSIIAAQKNTLVDNPLELARQSGETNATILNNITDKFHNFEEDQGWFSNFVDNVTGFFGARTRKDIAKMLEISEDAVAELQNAVKTGNYELFKTTYQKVFGVPFDPRVIQAQNEIGSKLAIINMADSMQSALNAKNKTELLKQIEPIEKPLSTQAELLYDKKLKDCSFEELKELVQNFVQTAKQLKESILKTTTVSKLQKDYDRLTASSPILRVQEQTESYMQNQETCVACAEIIGDIAMTAFLPGSALFLLGKMGKWGYRAKTMMNVMCKVMDSNKAFAITRNIAKTSGIVYSNHRLVFGQSALDSLKAAGEMSMFGLIGFGNSALARILIKGSGTLAKYGQETASMLGDALFMELYNKVCGHDLNVEQDITQFLAIYILGKLAHSAVNGNHELTQEERAILENIQKELGIKGNIENISTKDLLKYASKKIKDTRLVKSLEKYFGESPEQSVRDRLYDNENFFEDFKKTGKPYEIASCEDGTYVIRFKDNTFNTGNKYTYCVLDKNMKLVKKYDNMTQKQANETIPNNRQLKFEYHGSPQSSVYVSFDAGIIENFVKKIIAQSKYTALKQKVDSMNDLLNFYGLKEETLKGLSDAETDKLIENLEIFEKANIPENQKVEFSNLFKENPDITKDLATMDAPEIAKKIGIDKLENGKNIMSNIENAFAQSYSEGIENITTVEELNEFRERIDKGELPKRLLGLVSQKELLLRLRELFPDEVEYNRVIESCRRKNGSLDQNKIKDAIKNAENNPEIKRLRDELKRLVPNEEEFNELVGQCKTTLNYEQAINYINLRDEIIKISSRSKIEGFWDIVDHTKLTMEQKQILRNMLEDLDYFYELKKYVKDPDVWNRMCKDAQLENGFIDIVKMDEAVTLHLFEGYINNARTKQDCAAIRKLMDETAMTSETRTKLSTQLHLKNDEVFDSEDWGAGYHESDFNVIRQKAYERAGVWDDRLMVGKPRATGATNAIFEQLKTYNRELTKYAPNIVAVGESGIRGRNIVTLNQKVFNHAKKLGLKCIIDLRDDASDIRIKIGDVEHFKFPISYDGSSDELVLKNLAGFFKRMDDGNFYIGCTQGSHRTDIALALNFALNKNCTYIPELLFLKRIDAVGVIKRIYNKVLSLTPEQRQAYGITDEVIRNMPASEAELDMRIKQIRD